MSKISGKYIGKSLNSKSSQKLLDHAKQSATDALEATLKTVNRKTPDAIDNFIGNKIPDRIMKVSRSSPQNNSETITNEHDKEIPTERYIAPEERWKTIDYLRLI